MFTVATAVRACVLGALAIVAGNSLPVSAKSGAESAMETISGVWVEGRGYDVTYGGTYEGCAQRCMKTEKCVMVEFYRPEKKCNLYDTLRPRKSGGASNVGIRRSPVRAGLASRSDR